MAQQEVRAPGLFSNPVMRQLGLLVGIAASVALGVAVVLWSQTPTYTLLYGNLSDKDVSAIMSALKGANIPYKVDYTSGAVMVPSAKVYDARMKLASAGLPKSASMGMEMLDQDQGFGTSQFVERARYQHALEEELARSISQLSNIRSARVHLAIPKQSVFVRENKPPSASVLVDLYPGRVLDDGQVAAIVHLVSASVPDLRASEVTVVDQQGNLLTNGDTNPAMAVTSERFQYTRKLEDSYVQRIEDILTPIVGADGVKAQVAAQLDFTSTEQTRESYNPDAPALRSEQVVEEQQTGTPAEGIPGALSNQPPPPATVPETTGAAGANAAGTAAAGAASSSKTTERGPENMRKRETRNYELDKTISHTRSPLGTVRRLSVAVLVNNKTVVGKDGKITRVERTPEEMQRITSLVKDAVGFDAARGDTINVINADFTAPPAVQPLPALPIWKQAWVWDAAKQVLGGLFVLFLVFFVLRPVLRHLMSRPAVPLAALPRGEQGEALPLPAGAGAAALPGQERAVARLAPPAPTADLEAVKSFVTGDPKLAAQVVRNWVGTE